MILKSEKVVEMSTIKGMELEEVVNMLYHVLSAPEDKTRECLEAIVEDIESELSGSNTKH